MLQLTGPCRYTMPPARPCATPARARVPTRRRAYQPTPDYYYYYYYYYYYEYQPRSKNLGYL